MRIPSPMFWAFAPFGTQLLCEQVVGRALQAAVLRSELRTGPKTRALFSVEYADVLGIPVRFHGEAGGGAAAATPGDHPRQEQSEAGSRRAGNPLPPRVGGYRIELPEERLTAEFTDDSVLRVDARPRRPFHNQECRDNWRRMWISAWNIFRIMRRSTLLFHVTHRLLYIEMARSGRGSQAVSIRPTQAHHKAMAGQLPRLQGRRLSLRNSCTRNWRTWPANGLQRPSRAPRSAAAR